MGLPVRPARGAGGAARRGGSPRVTPGGNGRPVGAAAVLFLCLFAGQAGVIALSPVLSAVAADFDVSTAAAGQLRIALGLAAGVTALAAARLGARFSLRALLGAGAA